MKKLSVLILVLALLALAGCGKTEDRGREPEQRLHRL